MLAKNFFFFFKKSLFFFIGAARLSLLLLLLLFFLLVLLVGECDLCDHNLHFLYYKLGTEETIEWSLGMDLNVQKAEQTDSKKLGHW